MKLLSKVTVLKDRFSASLSAFRRDEEGATMIEYALIAALLSVVAIGVLTNIGGALVTKFEAVLDGL